MLTVVWVSNEIIAVAWSPQPPTAREKNASLLALGNAAGSIYFLRIENNTLQICATLQISDAWITELRWTHWTQSENSG